MTQPSDTLVTGGRPSPEERRTQLLQAAREVFVRHGYHAAAMDEIAAQAGVSKPVLYQHFPGKLDLYLALLEQSGQELVRGLRAGLASSADNKLRAAATVRAYFTYVGDPGGAFRLIFESDHINEPAVRSCIERVHRQCAEAISEVIAADTGRSHPESLVLAAGLAGMAQMSARYWLASRGAIPQELATELVSTLGWRGIRGFPRREDLAGAPTD